MNRRILLPILYLFAVAFAATSTLDLEQKNEETLFMTRDARNSYEEFRRATVEPVVVVGRTRFSEGLPPDYRKRHAERLEILKSEPGVDIVTPSQIAPLARVPDAAKSLPRLSSDDGLGFIAMIEGADPAATEIAARQFIRTVEVDEVLTEGELRLSGLPYINLLLDRRSRLIKTQLFPAMFALGFALLLILTRRLRETLTLFVPALGSFLLTLGCIGAAYETLNMITAIVPIIAFVLALALSLQVWTAATELGSTRLALREKGWPIALTIVTTGIGFGSLHFSEVIAVRQFADATVVGLLIAAGSTLLWIGSLGPRSASGAGSPTAPVERDASSSRAATVGAVEARRRSWAPLAFGTAVLLLAAWFGPRLPVNTDAFTYFSDDLRHGFEELHSEVLGVPILEILVPAESATNPTSRAALVAAEESLEATLPEECRMLSWRVMVDAVGVAMLGKKVAVDGGLAASAAFRLLPEPLRRRYPEDGYRITVFGPSIGVEEYRDLARMVRQEFRPAGVGIHLTGLYSHLIQSQSALVATLVRSFSLTLLIIAGIFALVYRRGPLVVIFVLTNVLPVTGGLIAIGMLGFSLNVATVMVFSVSLGIAVDASLHVIHGRRGDALGDYRLTTERPILRGALVMIPAFAIFAFIDFLPIRQFGVTLASTLLLALAFDLWVLPRLLDRFYTPSVDSNADSPGSGGDGDPVQSEIA
ncbi:MAG: hypothetical protein AAF488_03735 [Planctomycetota bacterium]